MQFDLGGGIVAQGAVVKIASGKRACNFRRVRLGAIYQFDGAAASATNTHHKRAYSAVSLA